MSASARGLHVFIASNGMCTRRYLALALPNVLDRRIHCDTEESFLIEWEDRATLA